jgi:hypothetical protein
MRRHRSRLMGWCCLGNGDGKCLVLPGQRGWKVLGAAWATGMESAWCCLGNGGRKDLLFNTQLRQRRSEELDKLPKRGERAVLDETTQESNLGVVLPG